MKLVLHNWRRLWQSVKFDTDRGQGYVRWWRRPPPTSQGWAFKHKGTWYAVWNSGTGIVFQAGTKQFPMSDEYHCINVRSGERRRFSIAGQDGGSVFELTYDAVDRDDDPTFDLTDLEQTDFLVWATRLWGDPKWKEDAVRNWIAQITA